MNVRARFWGESALAVLSIGLLMLTLVSRDWIERVFHIEPDQSSGALEWLIVAGLFAAAVAFSALARAEWRHLHAAEG